MNTTEQRIGNWLGMPDGHRFYPLDPRASEVRIDDIAHALAGTCRWGGRCDPWYSVAQHSLHVMEIVERTHPELALRALLHDAAEAYIGDIPTPLKEHMALLTRDGFMPATEIELRIQDAILRQFGTRAATGNGRNIIKHADSIALVTEARDLMGDPEWAKSIAAPEPVRITGHTAMTPPAAKRAFLAAFKRLRGEPLEEAAAAVGMLARSDEDDGS